MVRDDDTVHLLTVPHRFPAETLVETVWLHFCFRSSIGINEDMPACKGAIATHECENGGEI